MVNSSERGIAEFRISPYGRQLSPTQRSVLCTFDIITGERHELFVTNSLLEAPNWTPDGKFLIFNAGGQLWRFPIAGSIPQLIDTGTLSNLNNDHLISPDGEWFYVSANDGHLYKLDSAGGNPVRVSNTHSEPFRYFLHGVSPDGTELAFVAIEGSEPAARRNIFTIPADGGEDKRLSDTEKANDGPEYSPDGKWIYFNSELTSKTLGHAQIFRMKRDGSGIQQMTYDNRVNWFPHISPDGEHVVFLSYPPGTRGHPADKDVIIRLMKAEGGEIRDLVSFFGGQGTINVNSWAPDSRTFAYVEYPEASAI
ncbi:TolB family protein (plasmid) [Agrobacterium leguminum]|uniref:Periplasmic component of the Tol biopolymer transport system n=1 Tax=Agrobacterium deltaense NCPPB 1641 TaxID=1183425 RepID=A0A1S7U982_9HYPH|nr:MULTISPECIES: TolB family protein [Agrobacterium]WFS70037.1 TolB family protein [Agrobacterium leguminum]CVI63322.1 conserved hypothetical protein [Agrobacterium deltaense NCPPB 1641]